MTNLPIKLQNEPLVDAIFELRFDGKPVSNIIPGFLYKELELDSLPVSLDSPNTSIPFGVRDSNSLLRYSCFTKLEWGDYFIVVGDRAIGIGCRLPYPGWTEFHKAITKVLKLVDELQLIEAVERYSFKYVNFIQSNSISKQISMIDIDLSLGGYRLADQTFSTSMTINSGESTHIINVASDVTFNLSGAEMKKGVIVDIDSIVNVDRLSLEDWIGESMDQVIALRHANKEIFFKCLSEEAIIMLKPSYE